MIRRFTARDVEFLREHRLGICSDCSELIAEVEREATAAPCDFCDSQNGLGIDSALVAGVAIVTDSEPPPTVRNLTYADQAVSP
jgi:hypothetical protein